MMEPGKPVLRSPFWNLAKRNDFLLLNENKENYALLYKYLQNYDRWQSLHNLKPYVAQKIYIFAVMWSYVLYKNCGISPELGGIEKLKWKVIFSSVLLLKIVFKNSGSVASMFSLWYICSVYQKKNISFGWHFFQECNLQIQFQNLRHEPRLQRQKLKNIWLFQVITRKFNCKTICQEIQLHF